jgi:hypothetical protein
MADDARDVGRKENLMLSRRLVFHVLLTPILLILAGCVSPGRFADLRDCGEFSVGVGPGLAIDVDLGYLSHPSFGICPMAQRSRMIGTDSRNFYGRWQEGGLTFPLVLFLALHPEGGWSPLVSYVSNRDPGARGGKHFGEIDFWLPPVPVTEGIRKMCKQVPFWTFHNAADFSVGATLVAVSARAGINPLEIIDFALGFLGLDIARDDPRIEEENEDKANQGIQGDVPSSRS